MLTALQEIMQAYENVDISHVDFRVRAAHLASVAIAKVSPSSEEFPQPQRRDGKEPCGECHLKPGETCDICGARAEATYAGIPLSELARSGVLGWHPGDEA